jgi:hypothetical protein
LRAVTRALARTLLPILALALVLPATAAAGQVSKRDRGAVGNRIAKRFDLTRAERQALDIRSTKVSGKEGQGVQVEITFRGNIERRLGRGHLRRAAVAVILRPKSRRARATVLATQGGGLRQRLLRRSRSRKVGVIRDGRRITFVVRGSGFSGVDAVVVKSFPRLPRPRRRARGAGFSPPAARVITVSDLIADLQEIEEELDDTDPRELSCDELLDVLDDLEELDAELADLLEQITSAQVALEERLERARRRGDMGAAADISEALQELEELRRQVFATGEALEELGELTERELRACQSAEFLALTMVWRFFDATEVFVPDARFFLRSQPAQAAQSRSPITAVRVIVPRQITNFLCPTQLPNGTISTIDQASDTLTCRSSTGGSIALDEQFRMNLRTSPNPSSGMGGRAFGEQDGSFKGPFNISGP